MVAEASSRRKYTKKRQHSVEVTRLPDLNTRGIINTRQTSLGRTILTRDADFTSPSLLSQVTHGVIYISYQPPKNEIQRLAERIASLANQLKPKPRLLVVIEHEYIEVYD